MTDMQTEFFPTWEAMVADCRPHWNERMEKAAGELIALIGIAQSNPKLDSDEAAYLNSRINVLTAASAYWLLIQREGIESHKHAPKPQNIDESERPALYRLLYAAPPANTPYWKHDSAKAFRALFDRLEWMVEPVSERRDKAMLERALRKQRKAP